MPGVMLPLLLALVGCTGADDPFDGPRPAPTPQFTDPGMASTGASPVVQLWRAPGRYQLAASTLPEGFQPREAFPVTMDPSPVESKEFVEVYRGVSPFRSDLEGRRSAPPGMKVEVAGTSLPYKPILGRPSWAIRNGYLYVAWKGDLPEGGVRVRYDGVAETLERRDFATAEMEPEAFVQYSVTIEDKTRTGMLLPAPSTVSYDVSIPADAPVFDTWVATAPMPLRNLASDGAWLAVSVTPQGSSEAELVGERVWVDPGGDGYDHVRLDLSPWAGQDVTLSVSTEPHEDNHFDHVFLGSPTVYGAPSGPPRRVVVIGFDTTRPQSFGFYGYERDTTPELDEVARHSVVFRNAWTPAPRTRPSFRSATTGRRPLDAVGAENIGSVFARHGFATAGIAANIHLQPRFDFSDGFDFWWFDGKSRADDQVDRALDFLSTYRDRDVYIFLHIMDPHMPYAAEGGLQDMFVSDPDPTLPDYFTRSMVYGWMGDDTLTDQRKQHIRDLYDAELRFSSIQVARFLDRLDRMGGKNLVVLHNDHGEEFWEHSTFEHNHTLYDDVTRGLLWVRAGAGQEQGRVVDAPATLADIAPTLYDFVGFTDTPPTDGRSLRPFLDGEPPADEWSDRPIGIAHLRYGYDRWAVVYDQHKYILHTGTGQEELYDLANDPLEQEDLSRRLDLAPWRTRLGPVHDMPAGRGWRIRTDLSGGGEPFELTLPEPATHAAVVPPSMTISNPRNQAWGVPPRKRPEEIGEVDLSADGTVLRYTPGSDPDDGLIFVLFGHDVSPDGLSATRGDLAVPFRRTGSRWRWRRAGEQLYIEPGTVFVPPPSEVERMRAKEGDASAEEVQQLCELGYLHGEVCGDAEGH